MTQSPHRFCSILLVPVVTAGVLALGSTGAIAQRARGVPQAFAVVQAPEAAVEFCHASTPRAAQDCAMAKCQKKASRGSCYAITACAPSGWAGIMGVKLKDLHFSETVCGAPSEQALLASLRAFCKGHMPGLEQCYVDQVWGPDGKSRKLDTTWTADMLSN